MVEVSLDGSSDDAEVVIVSAPIIDGTLIWKFTETYVQRIILDHAGSKVNQETLSWDDAAEDLWFD